MVYDNDDTNDMDRIKDGLGKPRPEYHELLPGLSNCRLVGPKPADLVRQIETMERIRNDEDLFLRSILSRG